MPSSLPEKDLQIVRDLAQKRAEYAADPINDTRRRMWRDMNGLRKGKPMCWITEIPWHEFSDKEEGLRLRVSEGPLRAIEWDLRWRLWAWENLHIDMILEPAMPCPLSLRTVSGFGIEEDADRLEGTTGGIGSRHFNPVIRCMTDVDKIKDPILDIDREATEKRFALLCEVYDDILPVIRTGVCLYAISPWDQVVCWTGVQEILLDMIDRPAYVHALIKRIVDAHLAQLDQVRTLNILSSNNLSERTGSGAYGLTDELPDPDPAHPFIDSRGMWGFATAQILGDVSPSMHQEFAIRYESRWMENFGLNYYGCCEPLHGKMGIMKNIPRLRKVSISHWCDVGKAAIESQGQYVFSHKPNPAHVAGETWQPDVVREDLRRRLEETQGIPCEVVLKDISTVRGKPERLIEFTKAMSEVSEEFAR